MNMRRLLRGLIPYGLRQFLRDIAGVTDLQKRVGVLEEILYESNEDLRQRSRKRWRESDPTIHLTWGRQIDGDAFISKVVSYIPFGEDTAILEIGPGYGRLLNAILQRNEPFAQFLGIDISEKHVSHLRDTFSDPRIEFLKGDAESFSTDQRFDVAMSSLTFKHIFPTFERALRNVADHLRPGGTVVFDLMEGGQKHFECDKGVLTSLREYEKPEVREMLNRCALHLVAFDEVQHDPQHTRLLVVARKP